MYPIYYPSIDETNRLINSQGLAIAMRAQVNGNALVTTKPFDAGEVLFSFEDAIALDYPTRFSIQVSEDKHIDHPVCGRVNHSHAPNIFIHTEKRVVISIKPITVGEMLVYYYPSTEWDMVCPFEYKDDDGNLLIVHGAKHTLPEELENYQLNAHILRSLEKEHDIKPKADFTVPPGQIEYPVTEEPNQIPCATNAIVK